MPKVLLKRFHNQNNRFFYYDVQKRIIGNNGTAKSINTEFGYYSQEVEDYFRDNIETPFRNMLTCIEKNEIGGETFSISTNVQQITKNFIYALIARGQNFNDQMNSEPEFWQALPIQFQHDFIAKTGIELQIENDVFSDYIITFMLNDTEIPFVLAIDGIYNYTLNGYSVINLPISPRTTVSLIHKSYANRVINKDNSVNMFAINRNEDVMLMNRQAFTMQLKRKWGYIICPEEDELRRLMNYHL